MNIFLIYYIFFFLLQKYFNDDFYEMDEGDQKLEVLVDIEDLQCGKY